MKVGIRRSQSVQLLGSSDRSDDCMYDHRAQQYARAAAAVSSLGAVAELVRLFEPWPGYAASASRFVSVLLICLFGVTAAALLLRERKRWIALSWGLAFAAPFAMLLHASVTRVGGSRIGLVYFAAAAVLAFLMKRAIAGGRPALGDAPASDVASPSSSTA